MEKTNNIQQFETERRELQHMINEGVEFEVEVTVSRSQSGFFGRFKKRVKEVEKRTFKVAEPTLATLDRLSALWLSMTIDETKLQDSDYLNAAKKLVAQETDKVAEVVAVAVLGEDLYEATEKGGVYTFKPDRRKLNELKALFLHSVKPSDLFSIAVMVTSVSNLGDFTNSIRLMSATRTSDPSHLIERQD